MTSLKENRAHFFQYKEKKNILQQEENKNVYTLRKKNDFDKMKLITDGHERGFSWKVFY